MGITVPIHDSKPPLQGETVVEIGPGKDPMRWPYKNPTRWCDLYVDVLEASHLAYVGENNLNYITGNVEDLSFIADKAYDYAYARQILEHTEDPAVACSELSRVAHRGYVATPSVFGEIYFGKPLGYHRWLVIERGGTLCFFEKLEYEDRPFKGWYINAVYHPQNEVHQEIRQHFIDDLSNEECVHLLEYNWEGQIDYCVFWADGRIKSNLDLS